MEPTDLGGWLDEECEGEGAKITLKFPIWMRRMVMPLREIRKSKKESTTDLLALLCWCVKKIHPLYFSITNLDFQVKPHSPGNRKASWALWDDLISWTNAQLLLSIPQLPFLQEASRYGMWNWLDCQGSWWSQGGKVDYKVYNHINYHFKFARRIKRNAYV